MVNCAYQSKELQVETCVFSAVIGVIAGLTSASVRMHRKRASHSRFVQDAATWRLVESRDGQGAREAPGLSVPDRVRFAPLLRMSIWIVQVQTRIRSRLPKEKVARTSRKFRCNFWRLAACGGFFRAENFMVLEARSILYAVRYAGGCCPPGAS